MNIERISEQTRDDCTKRNGFVKASKNLARYRSENNFVRHKMIMWDAQTSC